MQAAVRDMARKYDDAAIALELLAGHTLRVRNRVDSGWLWKFRRIKLTRRSWVWRMHRNRYGKIIRRRVLRRRAHYHRRIPNSRYRVHAPQLLIFVMSESKLLVQRARRELAVYFRDTGARVLKHKPSARATPRKRVPGWRRATRRHRFNKRWYTGAVRSEYHRGEGRFFLVGFCVGYRGASARSIAQRGAYLRRKLVTL